MSTTSNEPFASWAVIELMGHRKVVGYAQEIEIGGGKLLRVDVPEGSGQPPYSQFYGTGSIYCMSPVTEEVARALIGKRKQEPFYAYALPQALPAPASTAADSGEEIDDDQEDLEF
jgi:hypothetical protein